ncbi:MAG TPA: polysaccharide deacetylase, partial [Chromatiales bacterium]|nr:polysaccharide deacetylase [Chromatiales bacterium]
MSRINDPFRWLFVAYLLLWGTAFAGERVGIVYSHPTVARYWDHFSYDQLFMSMQHQTMMAGLPFDLLTEDDLTDAAKLQNYSSLLIPYMQYVTASKAGAIVNSLSQASAAGVGLITAGNFMTHDENGNPLALTPSVYQRLIDLFGVTYSSWGGPVALDVRAADVGHPAMQEYAGGELIHHYDQIWYNAFVPVEGQAANVLATMTSSGVTYNAVLATVKGGRNVHFANEQIMADENIMWGALRWSTFGDQNPVVLKMGRQNNIFIARNDMDQSMFAEELAFSDIPLYDLLVSWKNAYNFVGSYYINIGNDPANGEYTDWSVSGPLYQNYMALGNEIGTHSWTHPDNTSALTPAQLEFEFKGSRDEIGRQLGITVTGAAIPGNPESLAVDRALDPWFDYISGRYGAVGAGYPNAFGWLEPDFNMIYMNMNMLPDFTLINWLKMTPAQAEAEWKAEIDKIMHHASQPIVHWMWHDYGPTQEAALGNYTVSMYTNTIAHAASKNSEFTTLEDLAKRMRALRAANLQVSGGNPVVANVNAAGVGQFSLLLDRGARIASVRDWYAYDEDQVFLPDNGGRFEIHLGGTQADVTHISRMPARARLLSLQGDGTTLEFTFKGEGVMKVALNSALVGGYRVTGADTSRLSGNTLTLTFGSDAVHSVAIQTGGGNQVPIFVMNPVQGIDAEVGKAYSGSIA